MPPVFTKDDKFVAFLCIFVVLLIFFVWYNTYKYMTLNTYLFVKLSIKIAAFLKYMSLGMLKNSGTQEKEKNANIAGNVIVVTWAFKGRKIKKFDFFS